MRLWRWLVAVGLACSLSTGSEAADRERLLTQPGVYGTYAAFKVDLSWWRLAPDDRRSAVAEAKGVFQRYGEKVVIDTYLLRGLSDSGDFLVRLHSTELIDNQNVVVELMSTTLGRYLQNTQILIGLTKKANYVLRLSDELKGALKSATPESGPRPYAIVIPIRKDAEWWNLDEQQRTRLMQEHTEASIPYLKTVNRKLYHSSGLDDFDFLTYFETAKPEDFNNLVIALERVKENRHNRRFGHPTLLGTLKPVDDILEWLAK
jgi:chlorite dismutase